MGRKTYEAAMALGNRKGFGGVRSLVFSRTLQPSDCRGVEVVCPVSDKWLTALKAESGKELVMGYSLPPSEKRRAFNEARQVCGKNVAILELHQGYAALSESNFYFLIFRTRRQTSLKQCGKSWRQNQLASTPAMHFVVRAPFPI